MKFFIHSNVLNFPRKFQFFPQNFKLYFILNLKTSYGHYNILLFADIFKDIFESLYEMFVLFVYTYRCNIKHIRNNGIIGVVVFCFYFCLRTHTHICK